MIITKIIGGLGNQMFQYSIGLSLAKKNNTDLLIDKRDFDKVSIHNGYELERVFDIKVKEAKDFEIKKIIGLNRYSLFRKISNFLPSKFNQNNYFLEEGVPFNKNYLEIKNNSYIYGHWQSEKYFLDYENFIRKKFSFKKPLISKNLYFEELIKKIPNSVSLHVRRGDYINNAKNKSIFFDCNQGYYESATKEIEKRIKDPTYFIFSDDNNWVKKNLLFKQKHYFVDHNSNLNSYNDMHLMSLCDHNIIANSTFSWWGAWLNSNQQKIVVSPKQWFCNNSDSNSIAPKKWLRV